MAEQQAHCRVHFLPDDRTVEVEHRPGRAACAVSVPQGHLLADDAGSRCPEATC